MHLIRALRGCKQRSLTVSEKAPTVSIKKLAPKKYSSYRQVRGQRICNLQLCNNPDFNPGAYVLTRYEGRRMTMDFSPPPDFATLYMKPSPHPLGACAMPTTFLDNKISLSIFYCRGDSRESANRFAQIGPSKSRNR